MCRSCLMAYLRYNALCMHVTLIARDFIVTQARTTMSVLPHTVKNLSKIGLLLVICGIVSIIVKPQEILIRKFILEKRLSLAESSDIFEQWKDLDVEFKVSLFHVENPEEVQETGAVPKLVEYGPYVYDEHFEKQIISVNESEDTLTYTLKRSFVFNSLKSGKLSETDEITILNPAYLGILLTIEDMFASFLGKFGNDIRLLFPDSESIFVRGQVKDILFDGLPLICDVNAHPELGLISTFLKSKRPPILRTTPENNVYAYSYFDKLNGTVDGPYVINRGVRDRYKFGNLKEYKGLPYTDVWYDKNCSMISGGDGSLVSPMTYPRPSVAIYSSDLCRSLIAYYKDNVVIHGVLGYRYVTSRDTWNSSIESSCYCPKASNGTSMCLPYGMLDLKKCQEVPVIATEPHFLHASEKMLSGVEGLDPDEGTHGNYLVVDPVTGLVLTGFKKIQFNMHLKQLKVVKLLSNVSDAFLPILWVAEGLMPELKVVIPNITLHRLLRFLNFLVWVPLVIGIFLIASSLWLAKDTKTKAGVRR